MDDGLFRIEHRIHIRCELTGASTVDDIAPYRDHPLVGLESLMDHTPGQRQWRNLADLKTYTVGGGEKTESEFARDVAQRMEDGPINVARNWPQVVAMFRDRGIPLATHDDTTPEDVEAAVTSGAVISEFPTTEAAAAAARHYKLNTILGGPNIVRGGSHSSGVSAGILAEKGLLDGISSDYVPASLLQAVETLTRRHGIALPAAMAKVTWRIADMVGLHDRGRLQPGLRADVLRFRFVRDTPVVAESFSNGRRAF
jgi:alpha-D-ribose 1-methylphosphonate 5-triphosphate diphosphatase